MENHRNLTIILMLGFSAAAALTETYLHGRPGLYVLSVPVAWLVGTLIELHRRRTAVSKAAEEANSKAVHCPHGRPFWMKCGECVTDFEKEVAGSLLYSADDSPQWDGLGSTSPEFTYYLIGVAGAKRLYPGEATLIRQYNSPEGVASSCLYLIGQNMQSPEWGPWVRGDRSMQKNAWYISYREADRLIADLLKETV